MQFTLGLLLVVTGILIVVSAFSYGSAVGLIVGVSGIMVALLGIKFVLESSLLE